MAIVEGSGNHGVKWFMKRTLCISLLLILIYFIVSTSNSSDVQQVEAQVSQLLRHDRAVRFFNSSPQQNFDMSWSVFTRDDINGSVEIPYPVISVLDPNGCNEVVQKINDTIWSFLDALTYSYVGFHYTSFEMLTPEVMRFDEEWFSIRYHGEIFNPARANAYAFAFNFDMQTGDLLVLEDVFRREEVLEALGNGEFFQVHDVIGYEHCPLHLEMSFRERRFLNVDENRNHDFFFDNDTLYLIINPMTARHYTIYRICLI